MEHESSIEVVGARTHNLQSVSCGIPHGRLTVVTGVSGSGKSSLAFDTLYAEGQRRYVETLSTYVRQFLAQMRKPPVDRILHMLPALALRQGNSVTNARSTVGTVSEVSDLLQVLFAQGGQGSCVLCGSRVRHTTVADAVRTLREEAAGERLVVLGALRPDPEQGVGPMLRALAAEGHRRLWLGDRIVEVDSADVLALTDTARVLVVLDRVQVAPDAGLRVREALESAYAFGEGVAEVVYWDREGRPAQTFNPRYVCTACGHPHAAPRPQLFQASSPMGACETCGGYGRVAGYDEGRVVPDPRLTLEQGAVAPLQAPSMRDEARKMLSAAQRRGVAVDVPWRKLPAEARAWVWRGGEGWQGLDAIFREMESRRDKAHVRILLARYRGYSTCRACEGSGRSAYARAIRVGDLHIGEAEGLQVDALADWLEGVRFGEELEVALATLRAQLGQRLGYLRRVGLGYLSLDRQARTLSGGEMHRVLLATSLGRELTDTCYVLDEPTAGLHPQDTEALLEVICALRDLGNTVVVVEHDPEVMDRADHVLELGPGGGEAGGRLLYAGDVAGLRASETPSGELLRRRGKRAGQRRTPSGWLSVEGATHNNLDGVSVRIPTGVLVCVTGVSGSGKSSLVHDVLVAKLNEARGLGGAEAYGSVEGDVFSEVVLVDQQGLGRSKRSCAVTLSGAYTPIREAFAQLPEAREAGLRAGAFSFNASGGRCERCEGLGVLAVEMHFLADIEVPCDVCNGDRFSPLTLGVRLRGRSIKDVLDMSIQEASTFFADHPQVPRLLAPYVRVGLGYLRLGQPTSQLSGGEGQRLKLAGYLGVGEASERPHLFVLDEPTVGLHLRDVEVLLGAIEALVDEGHSVVVVEHNMDLVVHADYVIDMGPGAGPAGGRIVAQGAPEAIALTGSATGRALAPLVALG